MIRATSALEVSPERDADTMKSPILDGPAQAPSLKTGGQEMTPIPPACCGGDDLQFSLIQAEALMTSNPISAAERPGKELS
jgi:hypothetical protein